MFVFKAAAVSAGTTGGGVARLVAGAERFEAK